MSLTLITPPATEPVTLDQAALQCRASADDNTLLTTYIAAARRTAEHLTGRKLIDQSWLLTLDGFPCAEIDLELSPITAVTSVTYVDVAGTTQTLNSSAWRLDKATLPGWLLPAYGTTWPTAEAVANAVNITMSVGWATADAVPEDIRLWILANVSHWYRNRESSTDQSLVPLPFVDGLLDPWRIWRAA